MKFKSFAFIPLSIALMAGVSAVNAGVNLNIDIGVPPPEPRVEHAPPPREGFVWIEGFWGWDGHRHVWNEGHWEAERRGYAYVPAHWDHEGDRWRFREGYWEQRKGERHEHHDHYDNDYRDDGRHDR